jgi:hypothetical protein
LSAWVFADPSITGLSGQVKDGEKLLLAGSDFGSREATVEFVGGKNGHIEQSDTGKDSSFGSWLLADGSGNDAATYVTTEGARSGNKSWVVDSDYNGSIRYDLGEDIPENTNVFMSWWVNFDIDEGDSGQWKMFRLSHHNDIQDSGTELTMFNWFGGNGDQLIIRPDRCPEGNNAISYYGGKYPSEDGRWVRIDQYLHTSKVGEKDGHHAQVLLSDNIERSEWSSSSDTEPKYPLVYTYNSDLRYRWFLWQNYRGNGLDRLRVWLDDIYIQVGSFSRVELGNAATFEDSNLRDIQPITSWSSGLIEIEFNQGGFSEGENAWLYVIDGDGRASSGYKVQIGGEIIDDGCSR